MRNSAEFQGRRLGKEQIIKNWLRLDLWLGIVLVCFAAIAALSWGKLDGAVIDIGREVEIPARLLTGQVLYRDIVTYYGPLAYYVNALALFIFGHRLEVFYILGFLLSLTATVLVYQLAKTLTNASWAALCTVCIMIYCILGSGIFNFVVPYSYAAVYATVLCLMAISCVHYYEQSSYKMKWLIAAAIACGLAGLSKQEYGVAAIAGVLAAINLSGVQKFKIKIHRSLLVILIASLWAFIPLALLAQQASWENIHTSLFPIAKADVLNRSQLFQTSPIKTLQVWWLSLKVFLTTSVVIVLAMVAAHWLVKSKSNSSQNIRNVTEFLISFTFASAGIIVLSKVILRSQFMAVAYPLGELSWFIPVIAGWLLILFTKRHKFSQVGLLGALLVFSLVLNSRWLFYINFYGLYATTVIILFFTLLYYLAQKNRKIVWHYLLICLLIGASFKAGNLIRNYNYAVSSDYGTFYLTDAKTARVFNQTIDVIDASGATSVLVLPEGNILNFLTATHSPSKELTFLPVALPTAQDEENFLTRMRANPPELIVYVEREFTEWGYNTYADFNPIVARWIVDQYQLIHSFDDLIQIYAQK
ncbi:ArnT family glycosyltransferase [Chroogloeocystis siderophila]|uniref:Glycosyltransferase RgtA/B/C/D-like domain-containing protein n=1 Tax=Chroogloeocystis siderophila 5.2 s.c.1 TaxID=247279 RepID=A0A1U7HGG0_9CHRO|nr:glycosyltransferase family 39 protein [Chroogloeocystis siderophila]OKH22644.1 hypothetical protein NIES1031_19505 [Chroogloeocystis siderophila 5.2 s.c.1]